MDKRQQKYPPQDDLRVGDDGRSDFDFIIGKWDIVNRRLKERLAGSNEWIEFSATYECWKILDSLGNTDCMRTILQGKSFEGMSLRLFDPQT